MRLKERESAPLFRVEDTEAEIFDMYKPKNKPLMLAFFRYASCPLCNLRVHELIENYDKYKDKIEIVLIFQSPKEKIAQYVGRQEIPYCILPDPQKRLYRLYGVESSWLGFAKAWTLEIKRVFEAVIKNGYLPGTVEGEIHRIPADFIISRENKIVKAFYGKDIGDHMPLDEIDAVLQKGQS